MIGQHRHGLGDPRIAWTVLLTATLEAEPDASLVAARLAELARAQSWPAPLPLAVTVDGVEITLAADHRYFDGQAMLAALSVLLDEPVRSLASGVDAERRQAGLGPGGLKRLLEAVARPSAVLPATSHRHAADDAIAHTRVSRRLGTSDVVVAATRALGGITTQPISVAVGVARPADPGHEFADNSGYLRIRDARGLVRSEVSQILRHAPLQPGGVAAGGAAGALAGTLTRILADRLGSTVLVSHLGDVVAEGVSDLAFYAVSGGASGLSVGAATIDGRTTLTVRARGDRHDRDGLERLLETITAAVD